MDLVITASSVMPLSNQGIVLKKVSLTGVAGQVTAGIVMVLDASGDLVKAQATTDDLSGTTAGRDLYITVGAAYPGSYIPVMAIGDVTIGAAILKGVWYCVSATAGLIAPFADLVATNRVSYLFYGYSTTVARMNIVKTGLTL